MTWAGGGQRTPRRTDDTRDRGIVTSDAFVRVRPGARRGDLFIPIQERRSSFSISDADVT